MMLSSINDVVLRTNDVMLRINDFFSIYPATVGEGLAPPEESQKFDKRKNVIIFIYYNNLFLQNLQ